MRFQSIFSRSTRDRTITGERGRRRCGVIYYYAAGICWSFNGSEDWGRASLPSLCLAEPGADSAQEYVSRSILTAGHDYFVVYDAVLRSMVKHRFSWFVRRGGEMPTIQFTCGARSPERHAADRRYCGLPGVLRRFCSDVRPSYPLFSAAFGRSCGRTAGSSGDSK